MSRLWPLGAYLVLLAALFVRFQSPDAPPTAPRHLTATADELGVVRRHHRAFYAILLAALVEWIVRGRPGAPWQLLGVALFAAGIAGYRRAGRALGDQLSPLVSPREPVRVVTTGPYRRVRHPMYRAELAMAFGAPLTLGATATVLVSIVFAVLVVRRIQLEEALFTRETQEYAAYAAGTHRLFPHVY